MKHTRLGNYIVYSSGKIESSFRWRGKNNNIITPQVDNYGYHCVRLVINGKRKKWKLHKLIAELFLEKSMNIKSMVCHKDGDKSNNSIENLYWGDAKTNARDRDQHGKTSRGHYHSIKIREGIKKAKANAHLIAAAPEMLEALESAYICLRNGAENREQELGLADIIEALLKKAKGTANEA